MGRRLVGGKRRLVAGAAAPCAKAPASGMECSRVLAEIGEGTAGPRTAKTVQQRREGRGGGHSASTPLFKTRGGTVDEQGCVKSALRAEEVWTGRTEHGEGELGGLGGRDLLVQVEQPGDELVVRERACRGCGCAVRSAGLVATGGSVGSFVGALRVLSPVLAWSNISKSSPHQSSSQGPACARNNSANSQNKAAAGHAAVSSCFKLLGTDPHRRQKVSPADPAILVGVVLRKPLRKSAVATGVRCHRHGQGRGHGCCKTRSSCSCSVDGGIEPICSLQG